MNETQNSGNSQNGQNNGAKPQLSWSQPLPQIKAVEQKPMLQMPEQKAKKETEKKSHTVRNVSIVIVALCVIGGVAWAIAGNKKTASTTTLAETTQTQTDTQPVASGAVIPTNKTSPVASGASDTQAAFPAGVLVVPSPQTAGLEVSVSNISVQAPTWVVIYENYNGQPGNVLGAALFTSDRTSGTVSLLRGTLPGQTYFAGEARDDGDHMFSKVNDPALRDTGGNPIVLKFQTK